MAAPHRLRSLVGWVILAVVLLTWAVTLRPTQLGGPATFIVVSGDSMEPTMSDGDLVVLRARGEYGIGDIVTFPVPAGLPGEGSLVIHRIVDTAGGTFVPQGDNRDQVDDWRPTSQTIEGSLWVHVPRGGEVLVKILQPPIIAGVAGGLVTMWLLLRDPQPNRRNDDAETD